MQNSNFQRRYIPVGCPQCRTQNNAGHQTCRRCGFSLTGQEASAPPATLSAASQTAVVFKILMFAVFFALLPVFYFYVLPRYNAFLLEPAAPTKAIELPADSWYKPTIWNYYRKAPTVEEIIDKNNQATSTTLRPSDLKNLSAKATVSFALGECLTLQCRDKKPAEFTSAPNELRRRSSSSNELPNIFPANMEINDNPAALKFEAFGEMEIHRTDENKYYRRTLINFKKLPQTTEIFEVFNGTEGWVEEIVYDRDKITGETRNPISREIKNLSGEELEEFKKSVSDLNAYKYSDKSFNYSHMAKVNGAVHFVLRIEGSDTSETAYFDAVTGLMTKMESPELNSLMFPYADFDGVKMPATIYLRTLNKEGRLMWMRLGNIEWKINQPIEDSVFEKRSENQLQTPRSRLN